ncbi:MAG: ribosome maturation factor RimP [bacterium]
MIKEQEIVEKVEEIAKPVVEGEGLAIYDIEYKREPEGWVLRLFLYREEGGISIDDCVKVSRQLNVLLDVEDIIGHPYNLEVSSPGLTRSLKKISHFEKSLNSLVKIKTKEPVAGERIIQGVIKEVEGNIITVTKDNRDLKIDFNNILSAKLEIDI